MTNASATAAPYVRPDCKDCGTTEGMGWSLTSYKGSGPHTARCKPCYLEYTRTLQNARNAAKAARRPPKPVKQPKPQRPVVSYSCVQCGTSFASASTNQFGGRRFCSRRCRGQWWAREYALMKQPAQPKQPKERPVPCSPLRFGSCVRCNALIVQRGCRKYCAGCRKITSIDAAKSRTMGMYGAGRPVNMRQSKYWHRSLCRWLIERDGPNCQLCGTWVDLSLKSGALGSDMGASIDHIIPRSKGGPDDLDNLRLTHWGCNRKRGNRDTDVCAQSA